MKRVGALLMVALGMFLLMGTSVLAVTPGFFPKKGGEPATSSSVGRPTTPDQLSTTTTIPAPPTSAPATTSSTTENTSTTLPKETATTETTSPNESSTTTSLTTSTTRSSGGAGTGPTTRREAATTRQQTDSHSSVSNRDNADEGPLVAANPKPPRANGALSIDSVREDPNGVSTETTIVISPLDMVLSLGDSGGIGGGLGEALLTPQGGLTLTFLTVTESFSVTLRSAAALGLLAAFLATVGLSRRSVGGGGGGVEDS